MVFFPNETFELWEPYLSKKDYDEYTGESIKKYEFKGTCPADFQTLTHSDSKREFGEILEDSYKAYIPLIAPITPYTIIRIQGEESTYSIRGTPVKNNHFLHHIKVILEKERIPSRL